MNIILQVEDTEMDVYLMEQAVLQLDPPSRLISTFNGAEAVAYLGGAGRFADRLRFPMPDLILLDLNMPGMGGLDVLHWIRGQTDLLDLPVIMFTTSEDPADIEAAYSAGATGYVVKPVSLSSLTEILKIVTGYWSPGGDPVADCADWLSITEPRRFSLQDTPGVSR